MTTRIFLFTDIHANLPAFETILEAIQEESPDLVAHLGDAVDMGPHPSEVVDGLLANPDWLLLRGNHEGYMDVPNRTGVNGEERSHQAWTRQQLRPDQFEAIHAWPMQIERTIEDVPLRFVHYARQRPPNETGYVRLFRPTPNALDHYFQPKDRRCICFGHLHHPFQINGAHTHYISTASAGPSKTTNQTAYVILTLKQGTIAAQQKYRTYDDDRFYKAMEERDVPARPTIYRIFYGDRFQSSNVEKLSGI